MSDELTRGELLLVIFAGIAIIYLILVDTFIGEDE